MTRETAHRMLCEAISARQTRWVRALGLTCLGAVLYSAAWPSGALAQQSENPPSLGRAVAFPGGTATDQVRVRLVPAYSAVPTSGVLPFALVFEAIPDWHIYWSFAGETGLPTVVEWDLPTGVPEPEMRWPVPALQEVAGLLGHVYWNRTALLGEFRFPPVAAAMPVTVAVKLRWGVCLDVCIPQEGEFTFRMDPSRTPLRSPAYEELLAETAPRLAGSLRGWNATAAIDGGDVLLSLTPSGSSALALPRSQSERDEGPAENLTFIPSGPEFIYAAVTGPARVRSSETPSEGASLTFRFPMHRSTEFDRTRLRGLLIRERGWDPGGRVTAVFVDVPVRPVGPAG